MNIGIDARTINQSGGVRTYILSFVEELLKDTNHTYHIFYNSPEMISTFPTAHEHALWPHAKPLLLIYDHISLVVACRKYKIDVLHTPKSTSPALLHIFTRSKSVTTIHDTIPLDFPETEEFFNRLYWRVQIPLAVKCADYIITDSDTSKHHLQERYFIPQKKIQTIYLSAHERFCLIPNTREQLLKKQYTLPKRYILFVGTIQPRKNITGVVRAFEKIRQDPLFANIQLVITGRKGWLHKQIDEILHNSSLKKDIHLTGFVPDEDIPLLMNSATLFVFPSFYEGFGLPVLEAMACGTPVVTSSLSSIPEIGSDAVLYCDPHDTKSIADAMKKVLKSPQLQDNLSKRGLEQAKKFSWSRTVERTKKVYNYVHEQR